MGPWRRAKPERGDRKKVAKSSSWRKKKKRAKGLHQADFSVSLESMRGVESSALEQQILIAI